MVWCEVYPRTALVGRRSQLHILLNPNSSSLSKSPAIVHGIQMQGSCSPQARTFSTLVTLNWCSHITMILTLNPFWFPAEEFLIYPHVRSGWIWKGKLMGSFSLYTSSVLVPWFSLDSHWLPCFLTSWLDLEPCLSFFLMGCFFTLPLCTASTEVLQKPTSQLLSISAQQECVFISDPFVAPVVKNPVWQKAYGGNMTYLRDNVDSDCRQASHVNFLVSWCLCKSRFALYCRWIVGPSIILSRQYLLEWTF